MSDVYRNPAKEPQAEELESRNSDMEDWGGTYMEPAGPAGRTTNVNGNEKGILEVGLERAMSKEQRSPLGSTHSGYRQGVYGDSNS